MSFRADQDGLRVAGSHLLDIARQFGKPGVLGSHEDGNEVGFHEGDGTMLHFARWIGFRVDIADFL